MAERAGEDRPRDPGAPSTCESHVPPVKATCHPPALWAPRRGARAQVSWNPPSPTAAGSRVGVCTCHPAPHPRTRPASCIPALRPHPVLAPAAGTLNSKIRGPGSLVRPGAAPVRRPHWPSLLPRTWAELGLGLVHQGPAAPQCHQQATLASDARGRAGLGFLGPDEAAERTGRSSWAQGPSRPEPVQPRLTPTPHPALSTPAFTPRRQLLSNSAAAPPGQK